jgi:hypothetical protein
VIMYCIRVERWLDTALKNTFLVQKYIREFYWQYLVPSPSKLYVLRFEVLTATGMKKLSHLQFDAFSFVNRYCCLEGICRVHFQVRHVSLLL